MHDLAAINSILQHEIERAAGKRLLAIASTVGRVPRLTDDTSRIEVGFEQSNGF